MSPSPSDPKLVEAVEYYLHILKTEGFEAAFHGLIDLDPEIVYPLIDAYHAEASSNDRSDLLRIIWEFRTPAALPLLEAAFRDRTSRGWCAALDGLVTLASSEAIRLLETVLQEEKLAVSPDRNYIEWVEEALEQAVEAHANNPENRSA
jgi:HEAT repeat protein